MEFFSLESILLFGGFTIIAIVSYVVGLLQGMKIGEKKAWKKLEEE